jgi:hypothetical protein
MIKHLSVAGIKIEEKDLSLKHSLEVRKTLKQTQKKLLNNKNKDPAVKIKLIYLVNLTTT